MVQNFKEYLINKLFESVSNNDLYLVISPKLKKILKAIDNPISDRLLSVEYNKKVKKTYIDIDENSIDKITFITSPKVVDIMMKDIGYKTEKDAINNSHIFSSTSDLVYNKYRVSMKINKFINEIFNNEYKTKTLSKEEKEENKRRGVITKAQELENFVNKYKSLRQPGKFELVNGDDILHWYLEDNYLHSINRESILEYSCMRHDYCQDYIKFYADNQDSVSLLILKDRDNENLICGRALVWKLDGEGELDGRFFMDRVYTIYDFDVELFKSYAAEKGWLYKSNQSSSEYTDIVDPTTKEEPKTMDFIIKNMVDNSSYPYMDTMKYYNPDEEILTNYERDSNTLYYLESTDGEYTNMSGENYSYEELVDMFFNDILDDFEYYVTDIMGSFIWDYVDDDSFSSNFAKGELDYYMDDFENVIDSDFIKNYIRDNYSDEELEDEINYDEDEYSDAVEKLNDMTDSEIFELVEEMDIRYDICSEYADDRFGNETAKDILDEFGYNTDDIDQTVYNMISNYIDDREAAMAWADQEDEDYLRERYEE